MVWWKDVLTQFTITLSPKWHTYASLRCSGGMLNHCPQKCYQAVTDNYRRLGASRMGSPWRRHYAANLSAAWFGSLPTGLSCHSPLIFGIPTSWIYIFAHHKEDAKGFSDSPLPPACSANPPKCFHFSAIISLCLPFTIGYVIYSLNLQTGVDGAKGFLTFVLSSEEQCTLDRSYEDIWQTVRIHYVAFLLSVLTLKKLHHLAYQLNMQQWR